MDTGIHMDMRADSELALLTALSQSGAFEPWLGQFGILCSLGELTDYSDVHCHLFSVILKSLFLINNLNYHLYQTWYLAVL